MKIAIVEDEDTYANMLSEYIDKYAAEKGMNISASRFSDAESFLKNYQHLYDIVFMDIELGEMDGMEAAHKLREFDSTVIIIFITNLARFASQGYEVNALDFVIKPVNYFDFSMKMNKAVALAMANQDLDITVSSTSGFVRVPSCRLIYVEVMSHTIKYVLNDEVLETRDTLKNVEAKLEKFGFLKCNSCYLVNPKFITKVKGYDLEIAGHILKISQSRKKEFMKELTDYLSGETRYD